MHVTAAVGEGFLRIPTPPFEGIEGSVSNPQKALEYLAVALPALEEMEGAETEGGFMLLPMMGEDAAAGAGVGDELTPPM